MKVKKTCIVCGKSFLAANPLYCLCSNDCRAKRKTVYKKRYEKTHAEAIREQKRKRNEKYREGIKRNIIAKRAALYCQMAARNTALTVC